MARAGLLGHPVAHSRSQQIMNLLSAYSDFDLQYELWDVLSQDLLGKVNQLRDDPSWVGANVTLPHKSAVLSHVSECSPEVHRIGAANTLVQTQRGVVAHNTDKVGFERALAFGGCDIKDQRVLLLGAGGAARAIVCALLDSGARSVQVINRTLGRAVQLCALDPDRVVASQDAECVDVLVNATSLGLREGDLSHQHVRGAFIDKVQYAVDLVYSKGAEPTAFLRWSMEHQIPGAMDGLPMLVAQAMSAFELWSKRPLKTELFRRIVRELRP